MLNSNAAASMTFCRSPNSLQYCHQQVIQAFWVGAVGLLNRFVAGRRPFLGDIHAAVVLSMTDDDGG